MTAFKDFNPSHNDDKLNQEVPKYTHSIRSVVRNNNTAMNCSASGAELLGDAKVGHFGDRILVHQDVTRLHMRILQEDPIHSIPSF